MNDIRPVRVPDPKARRRRLWMLMLGLVAALVVIEGVAAITGYFAGQEQSRAERAQEVARANQEQFDLGVQDLLAARYALARQRFEYILSLDPNYPGAAELLSQALQALNVPTPTLTLTPVPATPSPTLDVSSLDGLLAQAQASFNAGDWTGALRALLAMRVKDPAYRLEEVNSLMASSLRNRGMEKIWQGYLEQGIYDLDLSERFRPLDADASSWRRTAEFYMLANSYVGLDWQQAVAYFSQLCAGGTWDSCWKYALSAMRYGDLLATSDPCGAILQYDASLLTLMNQDLVPTATEVAIACLTATAATPTSSATPETPTPTLGTLEPGTPTPTLTPTVPTSPTASPTSTP